MRYTQIDKAYVLNLVQRRIQELEGAHAQLDLRISAPSPGDVITSSDRENLQTLETSIERLRERVTELSGEAK